MAKLSYVIVKQQGNVIIIIIVYISVWSCGMTDNNRFLLSQRPLFLYTNRRVCFCLYYADSFSSNCHLPQQRCPLMVHNRFMWLIYQQGWIYGRSMHPSLHFLCCLSLKGHRGCWCQSPAVVFKIILVKTKLMLVCPKDSYSIWIKNNLPKIYNFKNNNSFLKNVLQCHTPPATQCVVLLAVCPLQFVYNLAEWSYWSTQLSV